MRLRWSPGEENSDLSFYEVTVGGVTTRVQDTEDTIFVDQAPPESVMARVVAVSKCGEQSEAATASTSVAVPVTPSQCPACVASEWVEFEHLQALNSVLFTSPLVLSG